MKLRLLLLITLIIITSISLTFAEDIEVGIYQNPPLVGEDENNDAFGFFVELLNYIIEKEDLHINYKFDYLHNGFKNLESGEIDLLLAIAYSDERSDKYIYNKEIIYTNWGQIYSNKSINIETFLDLENKTIGVEIGDIHYVGDHGIKKTLEDFNVKTNFIEYHSRTEMLKDLESKKLDTIVVSRLFGEYYESNYKIKLTPIQFNPVKIKVIIYDKKNQYLLDLIDEYLIDMKNDPRSIYYEKLNSMLSLDAKLELPAYIIYSQYALLLVIVVACISILVSRKIIRNKNIDILIQNQKLKKIIEMSSDLPAIKTMNELFDTLTSQLREFSGNKKLEIISLIDSGDRFVLDEDLYISKKYRKYANRYLDEIKLDYLDCIELKKIKNSSDQIFYKEKMLLIKYNSSHKKMGYLYIESFLGNFDIELISIYVINTLSNLQTIISNMNRTKEKTQLFISLGQLIEKRDVGLANHVNRVSEATELLSSVCGYEGEKLNNIVIASSIHDIGKIHVPDSILNKPGKLTEKEFEIIKTHATDNFKIPIEAGESLSKTVHEVVRYHHENWDGTGYPEGLSKEEIPHEARIVSIIDVFEALTHNRTYKDAWTYEESIAFINESKGVKFDPKIVETFLNVSDQIYRIFNTYTD